VCRSVLQFDYHFSPLVTFWSLSFLLPPLSGLSSSPLFTFLASLQYFVVCHSVNSLLQCVAVCCCSFFLQCIIAVCCCSVLLRCVAVCCISSTFWVYLFYSCTLLVGVRFVAVCCSMLQCVVAVCCCSVLHCGVVCCIVLLCVAVCCSVLQCVAVCCSVVPLMTVWSLFFTLLGVEYAAVCCNGKKFVVAVYCCSVLLQRVAVLCR